MPTRMDPGYNSWAAIILKQGVPAAIAVALVYWMAVRLESKLEAIDTAMTSHVIATNVAVESIRAMALDIKEGQRETLIVQRQTCVILAKSDEQRRGCVR